ncbi:MAG: pyridoxal phosphate-dependent aminotransferase [Oscillospiraceae bacterium]|nr:pyridoxal phosphate-dependent aminotransferase [Oscillospiraceae bacterium]
MINETMYQMGNKLSVIRELFSYGLKQAAVVGRENVFDFSIGNPSVPSPQPVIEAFRKLCAEEDSLPIHSYTLARGSVEARTAVAANLSMRTGTLVRPDNIFLTCGAAPALCAVMKALSHENSEILVIAPYFAEYRPFIEFSGNKMVVVPADMEEFQINFPELEKLINENTQAIVVNSPNNPTGAVYSYQTLSTLSKLLKQKSREYGHPIYIIADEPYRELVYDDAYVHYIPDIYHNTIICYSYSKVFSLPGERIGYFFIPDCVQDGERLYFAASGAARINGHVCAPSLQQKVIQMCADVKPDISVYDRNRVVLYDALTSYGYECVKPQGAFYLFVKAPYGTAKEFSDVAKLDNLLIVPGDEFGCPEYFRASICVSYDMILRSLPIFKKLIDKKP